MPADRIVLSQLGPWAEDYLQTIAKATTQSDFDQAFDDFVAKEAVITFNGGKISRDQYKAKIRGLSSIESKAAVSFNGITTVPGKDKSSLVGEAGIFYTTIITEGTITPLQREIPSSINISVRDDPSAPKPPPHTVGGDYDPRKVFAINQVMNAPSNTSNA